MADSSTVTGLVVAAERGDQSAWRALVDRYTPLVASIVQGFRLQAHDAEDVHQTVWLRLVEHLGDLREPRALPRWIITITRNESLRLLKTTGRTRPFDPLTEHETVDTADHVEPDQDLLKAAQHQVLLAAFAELPDHQRDLLLLLVADPPVPYAEISKQLGIPLGSIGPTRARALQRLRESPLIAEWRESDPNGGGQRDIATLGR
jgi:RNA polymerase sigma factor (sigma-70 family)